ncbi:MAG: cyclohexadienyl dehydrogenase [Rhodospirillaceae bacterium]|jgi:cyclohexadieny/prephenate dehydrogenase|nr:cyclohexadienyl dehydrogenase [Rhodospirillaceae bacterium]|tara:strand:+ start:1598 stop:2494 length:897 start_codon:yes stop_codon:yes gene_type:complete
MGTADKDILFPRMALIGAGLIGSSLARVVRRQGLAGHIAVCARTQATLDKAMELGFADSVNPNPAEAAKDADLVVLCTPLGVYGSIAEAIAPALKSGAIVSDVGSCKEIMFTDVAPHLPEGVYMVPGHPVAGTEHSGPEAGFAELFEGRWCILTPGPETDADAVERLSELWRRAGMTVEIMDAAHHDQVLALTSHLPHLIAYTIVGTATDLGDELKKEVFKFAAGGFRDFTRIAASDPVMWRDIFLNNKDALLEVLGRFTEDLTALQRAIRRGEEKALEDHFTRTRGIRRGVIEAKQD